MTTEEICTINNLRSTGLGYKKIAAITGLPVNRVKVYCRRHKLIPPEEEKKQVLCRHCGKPIVQTPKQKPRQFCSDICRMQFWNKHRDQINHRVVYSFHCPQCGREFVSYGNPHRKYCSRECVANARRKGGTQDGCC